MKPAYYCCGVCNHYHPVEWNGDCREDANRFTIGQLDKKHGSLDWNESPMPGSEDDPVQESGK